MRKVRMLVVTFAFGLLASLGWAVPAHALDCARGPVDTVCSTVIGTYCKVTHRSTCYP